MVLVYPLSDDIVSVGCTGDMQYLFDKSRGKPEEVWAEELERCPALKRRLENAQQCESFYVTKDYSYKATQPAGPGMGSRRRCQWLHRSLLFHRSFLSAQVG